MPVDFKDYYRILGVERSASQEEIEKAFRALARKYHPDVSKEPDAESRFKEINEAREVLSDAEKRKRYDQLGRGWKHGQGFTPPEGFEGFHFDTSAGGFEDAGGFSDFFKTIFGSGAFGGFSRTQGRRGTTAMWSQRGEDLEAEIEVTLEEAYHGATKRTELVEQVRRGDGSVTSRRRNYDVKIPRGVTEGSRIRLAGQGGQGTGSGPAGDLLLRIRLRKDPRFEVDGHDLRARVRVSPSEAALGGEVTVPTIDGSVTMKIAPGTQGGQTLRLRGKGLPRCDGPEGDLLVTVQIAIPQTLSERERELYQALADEARKHGTG
jgi:curved DNA-binding protein